MEYLALLIPVIVSIILLLFFRDKTVWWEYLVLLLPTIIIFFSIRSGMISYKQSDVEYLGYHVTGTVYYEKWDEYIHRTCSRTSGSGKHAHTTYYDCSYVSTHSPYWVMILNDKSEITISQEEYNALNAKWETPKQFVDMNRHFHRIDGDSYYSAWNLKSLDTKYITREDSYINKIRASNSIFNFENIDEKDVKLYKLYDYPKINGIYQSTIISKHKLRKETQDNWDFMNSFYGKQYQFRSYIIFFYNQPESVIDKQLSYWKGVNKNEMNIFIGVDSVSLKRQWTRISSWSDKPELEIDLREFINKSDTINIDKINTYLTTKISSEWHRKNFKDFDYIDIELTDVQLDWLIFILFLYNVLAALWVIKNEFTNEPKNAEYNRNNYINYR